MYATPEQVAHLKARSQRWEDNGFPTADPLIPPIVTVLNKFDGIACVFSCEGHTSSEPNQPGENFYLMLAATEVGSAVVFKLYERLHQQLHDRHVDYLKRTYAKELNPHAINQDHDEVGSSRLNRLMLSYTSRVWPDAVNGEHTAFYNVLLLEGDTSTDKSKAAFFRAMTDVLIDF